MRVESQCAVHGPSISTHEATPLRQVDTCDSAARTQGPQDGSVTALFEAAHARPAGSWALLGKVLLKVLEKLVDKLFDLWTDEKGEPCAPPMPGITIPENMKPRPASMAEDDPRVETFVAFAEVLKVQLPSCVCERDLDKLISRLTNAAWDVPTSKRVQLAMAELVLLANETKVKLVRTKLDVQLRQGAAELERCTREIEAARCAFAQLSEADQHRQMNQFLNQLGSLHRTLTERREAHAQQENTLRAQVTSLENGIVEAKARVGSLRGTVAQVHADQDHRSTSSRSQASTTPTQSRPAPTRPGRSQPAAGAPSPPAQLMRVVTFLASVLPQLQQADPANLEQILRHADTEGLLASIPRGLQRDLLNVLRRELAQGSDLNQILSALLEVI